MNESNMPREWWHEQDQDEAWVKQQEEELQRYEEASDSALFADGFEDAFMGIGYQFNQQVAIYDHARCIQILQRQGMTSDEALEYMEFNVLGAYVGRATPVFLTHPGWRVTNKEATREPVQLELPLYETDIDEGPFMPMRSK